MNIHLGWESPGGGGRLSKEMAWREGGQKRGREGEGERMRDRRREREIDSSPVCGFPRLWDCLFLLGSWHLVVSLSPGKKSSVKVFWMNKWILSTESIITPKKPFMGCLLSIKQFIHPLLLQNSSLMGWGSFLLISHRCEHWGLVLGGQKANERQRQNHSSVLEAP